MEEKRLFETVSGLLMSRNYQELRRRLSETEPQDIAALCQELDESERAIIFRLLSKDLAAEAFSEMSPDIQEELIKKLSDSELQTVLDGLYIDDTVDMIEEMPANVVKRILANSDRDTREQINLILNFPKDSAGSIMTVEYVRLDRNMTVADAFSRIRRVGTEKETIYTCYVTDSNKKLVGVVTGMDLMLSDTDTLISDIMNTSVISVNTEDDKEEVAQKMSKYNFLAIPVVDRDQHLVGIVTVDDAMDVMSQEATEDIEKMAAILPTEKPYFRTGVLETWLSRIPWLMLLMLSATFTGAIISKYEVALGAVVILTSFIPMLMDTAGNAGGQASVTVIRALSLGEVVPGDILRVLWKELRVSFLCGVSLAAVGYIKAVVIDGADSAVALAVCITLSLTVVMSKLVGCCLPIITKKIGFDPAVMASPFITTIVDALSLLVYFSVATAIIPALG